MIKEEIDNSLLKTLSEYETKLSQVDNEMIFNFAFRLQLVFNTLQDINNEKIKFNDEEVKEINNSTITICKNIILEKERNMDNALFKDILIKISTFHTKARDRVSTINYEMAQLIDLSKGIRRRAFHLMKYYRLKMINSTLWNLEKQRKLTIIDEMEKLSEKQKKEREINNN